MSPGFSFWAVILQTIFICLFIWGIFVCLFVLCHQIGLNWCLFKTIFTKTKERNFIFPIKKAFTAPAKGNFHKSPLQLELWISALFLSCFQKQRLAILYLFSECCYPKLMNGHPLVDIVNTEIKMNVFLHLPPQFFKVYSLSPQI